MDDQMERFVDTVGGVGLFQVLIFLFANLARLGSGWAMLFMSFGNYNPGWTCIRLNDTGRIQGNGSENVTEVNPGMTMINQSSDVNMLNQSQLVTVPGTCDIIDSCVEIHFNPESSTITTEWGLICDKSWVSSVITSVQMVAIAIGAYLSGRSADRFGRKITIYVSILLCAVTNGVAAFSVSWEMFAALRFFIGLCIGANLGICSLYPFEFFNSKWRTVNFAIPSWDVIVALFGLVAYLFKDWRHIHLAIMGVSLLTLLTAIWMPESIRWLVVHGEKEKAKKLAQKICRYNKKPPPKEEDIDFKISDERVEEFKKSDLLVLLRKPLLKRVSCGFFMFFTVGILYYAIVFGIQVLFGDFYLNFIAFAFFGMPIGALIPLFGIKLGRRWGTFTFLCLSGILALGVVIVFFTVEDEVARGWTINILAILTSTVADATWGLMTVFITELFPTPVRATAYSVIYTGARLGGILAPYLLPKSYDLLYVAYLIMMALCAICCGLTLALPETKDLSMESELAQCDRKPHELLGKEESHSQLLNHETSNGSRENGNGTNVASESEIPRI